MDMGGMSNEEATLCQYMFSRIKEYADIINMEYGIPKG